MAGDYIFLVKTMKAEELAEKLLDGILFMNTIEFFRGYEEDKNDNISDPLEGVSAYVIPEDTHIEINIPELNQTIKIEPKDVASPVLIKEERFSHTNVFCLTALHSSGVLGGSFSRDDFNSSKEGYLLPDDRTCLGDFSVVITDFGAFLSRVRSAIESKGNAFVSHRCAGVNYFPEDKSYANEVDSLHVFSKRGRFIPQKEYRVAVDCRDKSGKALTLEIGSIRDIAQVMPTAIVNDFIGLCLDTILEQKWPNTTVADTKKSQGA